MRTLAYILLLLFVASLSIPPISASSASKASAKKMKKKKKKSKPIAERPNFGVDYEKLKTRNGNPRYFRGGREIEKEEAYNRLAKDTKSLADDSKYPRITAIGGSTEQRRMVLMELKAQTELKGIVFQEYPIDDQMVKDYGFDLSGNPRIILQSADGQVLHSQANFEGGAPLFMVAFRKAYPDYDPKKDPDLRYSMAGLSFAPSVMVTAGVCFLAALSLASLYLPRGKKQ